MTTPRSSASSATAGVGSTPPRMQSPPAETTPRANASSSSTPERARVAADEDLRGARPEGRCAAEALDELGREELTHDAAHPIGAEVLPCHEPAR